MSRILASLLLLFVFVSTAQATSHVMISEVQLSGDAGARDEFVELYNPTDSPIDLTGWRLTKKTSGGTESNLVSSFSISIQPHSYLLVAHPEFNGPNFADLFYSASSNSLSTDNTVTLYSDAGLTVVDALGIGAGADGETTNAENIGAGISLERKALSTSTLLSMSPGGMDAFFGNGFDSNNNANDFVVQDTVMPQSSSMPAERMNPDWLVYTGELSGDKEIPPVTTPAVGDITVAYDDPSNSLLYYLSYENLSSDETGAHFHGPASETENAGPQIVLSTGEVKYGKITLTNDLESLFKSGQIYINIHSTLHPDGEIRSQVDLPENQPSPTPSPTLGLTPSPTPEPTPTPTPSPTSTPSPSPTPTVEPTPTITPEPTDTPTPTPTTEPTPSPEPTLPPVMFGFPNLECRLYTLEFSILGRMFSFPQLMCGR